MSGVASLAGSAADVATRTALEQAGADPAIASLAGGILGALVRELGAAAVRDAVDAYTAAEAAYEASLAAKFGAER